MVSLQMTSLALWYKNMKNKFNYNDFISILSGIFFIFFGVNIFLDPSYNLDQRTNLDFDPYHQYVGLLFSVPGFMMLYLIVRKKIGSPADRQSDPINKRTFRNLRKNNGVKR